jgi:hypothetical protein
LWDEEEEVEVRDDERDSVESLKWGSRSVELEMDDELDERDEGRVERVMGRARARADVPKTSSSEEDDDETDEGRRGVGGVTKGDAQRTGLGAMMGRGEEGLRAPRREVGLRIWIACDDLLGLEMPSNVVGDPPVVPSPSTSRRGDRVRVVVE